MPASKSYCRWLSSMSGAQPENLIANIRDDAWIHSLIDSIGEGLVIVNEYGNITDVNQAATDILGYGKNELLEKWLPKTLPNVTEKGVEVSPVSSPVTLALETGKPVTKKTFYKSKNGVVIPIFLTVAPFLVQEKPTGAVIVFRDMTHEREIEQAKDEFVSLASHQLRTPLTAIRLFTELLTQKDTGPLNSKQIDYIDKISSSTIRMIKLVGDILNVSRIEMGRIKVEPQPADLVKLIGEKLEEVQPLAAAKAIKLEFIKPARLELAVDTVLMDQIVHNLLTNAIRYTQRQGGQVTVTLAANKKEVSISVADNGIGIPAAVQDKIFTRFFRADNAILAEGEGTGLGLYLLKLIAEVAGCKIWFESKQDQGTTFYVTIPQSGMKARKGEKSLTPAAEV